MHAYVFESDACIDQDRLAREFAKAILCQGDGDSGSRLSGDCCGGCIACQKVDHENHEDIVYVEVNERGNILDKAIENLQTQLKRKPLAGDRTIAIIPQADTMTERAQNRLLKTLEEPLGGAVIILLSSNIENLIQTIRSRCVIFRINDYSSVPGGEMMELAGELAEMMISSAPTYQLFQKLEAVNGNREAIMELLDALEFTYRELLLGHHPQSRLFKRQYIYDAVSALEEAKRSLSSITGLKAEYMLRSVLLKIGG